MQYLDGLINGGLISGWAYIWNKYIRWQMDGLISEGLKTGGSLKWDFTVCNWCQYY